MPAACGCRAVESGGCTGGCRDTAGGMSPFGFGRQRIGPAGVGIGLQKTDVADRGIEVKRPQSAGSVNSLPGAAIAIGLSPVQRRPPAAVADAVPASGQPQLVAR